MTRLVPGPNAQSEIEIRGLKATYTPDEQQVICDLIASADGADPATKMRVRNELWVMHQLKALGDATIESGEGAAVEAGQLAGTVEAVESEFAAGIREPVVLTAEQKAACKAYAEAWTARFGGEVRDAWMRKAGEKAAAALLGVVDPSMELLDVANGERRAGLMWRGQLVQVRTRLVPEGDPRALAAPVPWVIRGEAWDKGAFDQSIYSEHVFAFVELSRDALNVFGTLRALLPKSLVERRMRVERSPENDLLVTTVS